MGLGGDEVPYGAVITPEGELAATNAEVEPLADEIQFPITSEPNGREKPNLHGLILCGGNVFSPTLLRAGLVNGWIINDAQNLRSVTFLRCFIRRNCVASPYGLHAARSAYLVRKDGHFTHLSTTLGPVGLIKLSRRFPVSFHGTFLICCEWPTPLGRLTLVRTRTNRHNGRLTARLAFRCPVGRIGFGREDWGRRL